MLQQNENEILTNSVNLLLSRNACILIIKNNPNDFKLLLDLPIF